jgi:hypothetical protein
MPEVLKPDLKAVVWLALGFLVLPKLLGAVKGHGSAKAAQ